MGRGRQKAKQTKVARALKYDSGHTDLDALQAELSGNRGDSGESELDQIEDNEDPYAVWAEDGEDEDEEDDEEDR